MKTIFFSLCCLIQYDLNTSYDETVQSFFIENDYYTFEFLASFKSIFCNLQKRLIIFETKSPKKMWFKQSFLKANIQFFRHSMLPKYFVRREVVQ